MYAPGEKAYLWDESYEKDIMALGWDCLGDLNDYDNQEDIEVVLQQYENTTKVGQTNTEIDTFTIEDTFTNDKLIRIKAADIDICCEENEIKTQLEDVLGACVFQL